MRVAQQLEAGNVSVNILNSVAFDMPFGGAKQSGVGRGMSNPFRQATKPNVFLSELGKDALEPYLETKSVFVNLA